MMMGAWSLSLLTEVKVMPGPELVPISKLQFTSKLVDGVAWLSLVTIHMMIGAWSLSLLR